MWSESLDRGEMTSEREATVLVDPPARRPTPRWTAAGRRSTLCWLLLSLLVTAIHGSLALREAFDGPYVIQTDARQYVTWLARYRDPSLFPDDLIAEYFQAVSPLGFRAVYWWFAALGVDPIALSKVLPLFLGLVTTAYAFAFASRLFPSPPAAFVSAVILDQSLWLTSDLVSATPRAFAYPLFTAFLYYLSRRSLPGTVISIALEGLFYFPVALVSAGTLVLSLVRWQGGRPGLTRERAELLLGVGGLLAVALVGLLSLASAAPFGPAMTVAEARSFPVFLAGGRSQFFFEDPWRFWVAEQRTGFMPQHLGPPLIWAWLLLALLPLVRFHFPLARRIVRAISPLPEAVVASFGLFFVAHAMLFRLYLPGRYTQHSVRVVLALAAGFALAVLIQRYARWLERSVRPGGGWRRRLSGIAPALVLAVPLAAPTVSWVAEGELPGLLYRRGEAPALYEFLVQQPTTTLVASVSEEADYLPPFAKRSVLVSPKYALPYHADYYRQIHQRARDVIRAHYTPDLGELREITQRYRIDYWLVRRSAFSPQYVRDSWMIDIQPEADQAVAQLRQGVRPALAGLLDRCAAFTTGTLVLVDTGCVLRSGQPSGQDVMPSP